MNMDDFNNKKQDIIELVSKGGTPNCGIGFIVGATIVDELKELKSPDDTPITECYKCKTCQHYEDVTVDVNVPKIGKAMYPHTTCTNVDMMKNLRIRYSKASNLMVEPTPEFGCPFHSGYAK